MKKLSLVFIFLLTFLLSYRLLNFINIFSVNLPYDDQWWVAEMIIEKKPIKDILFYWYSEHRIGVGLILMKSLAVLSHWNTRYENFGVGVVLIFLTLLALALKYKITKNITFSDITIPILFLNLHQYENLMEGFRIMYLIPVILFFIYFWLREIKTIWKNVFILIVIFLSSFSGFHGLFLNIFVFFTLFTQIIHEKKKKIIFINTIVMVMTVIITALYFYGFTSDHSDLTLPSWQSLIEFPIRMINGVLGLRITFPVNLILPIWITFSFIYFIFLYFKKKKYFLTPVLFLYFYAFFFIITITFGRNKFGLELAYASRYVSHMMLLYFAAYLTFTQISNIKIKCVIFVCVVIPILLISVFNNKANYLKGVISRINKKNWIQCYQGKKSVSECNNLTDYFILNNKFNNYLQQKMELLEIKKWSIFTRE